MIEFQINNAIKSHIENVVRRIKINDLHQYSYVRHRQTIDTYDWKL